MVTPLGIDVGGSFIKFAAVDVGRGVVLGEVRRLVTPPRCTPAQLLAALEEITASYPDCEAVGVAFPAVVRAGVVLTATNIDVSWIGFDLVAAWRERSARKLVLVHDSDAAGIAEMYFGAGHGRGGRIMMLTLGTGIGTTLFTDGHMYGNLELGRLRMGEFEAEQRASARARIERGLGWEAWAHELNSVLAEYHRLLWPDTFIIGGGASEEFEAFSKWLQSPAEIVPARLGNAAGVIGAALMASQRLSL